MNEYTSFPHQDQNNRPDADRQNHPVQPAYPNYSYTYQGGASSTYQLNKLKRSFRKTLAAAVAVCCIFSLGLGAAGGYFAASLAGKNNTVSGGSGSPVYTNGVGLSAGGELTDMIDQASKAVVAITVQSTVRGNGFLSYGSFSYPVESAGSGVIISADGYIVTNNHVIDGADQITIYLSDGSSYPAKLVGTDSVFDIALLKVDATGLPFAVLGDSDTLRVGDTAIAIGNPLGQLAGTVSRGIISGLDRQITLNNETMNLLQTDAAVNPGNSGGALLNANGEVVGIVVAKSGGTNVEGLGFAVPVNDVKVVVDDLMQYGYVTGRPALGISLVSIDDPLSASSYRVNRLGLYVADPGSTQLQSGDCIIRANGAEISNYDDLKEQIEAHAVGDTMELTVLRNNQETTVRVTLVEKGAPVTNT